MKNIVKEKTTQIKTVHRIIGKENSLSITISMFAKNKKIHNNYKK
jgi:hypothetical protein